MTITTQKKENRKGFTLLFAVLVSVLILAVGASIISIALKQVVLSGAGRESQFAFYASNTGLECALYWDLHPRDNNGNLEYVFPAIFSSEGVNQTEWTEDEDTITCAGGQIKTGEGFDPSQDFTDEQDGWLDNRYTFRMAITNNLVVAGESVKVLYCAEVEVVKDYDDDTGRIKTTITSQGLNTCDPENNPRAVERGLVLEYES